jgi:hypothetical protein
MTDDIIQIQQTVLDFAARDQSRWDDLLAQFHPDGGIQVTWFRGPFAAFVEASRCMAGTSPVAIKHLIWPPRVRVAGDRGVAYTQVAIMLRRVCIYERDRLDPVDAPADFGRLIGELDLRSPPAPHRHLAGALATLGALVPSQVCAGSDQEQAIFASDQSWLDHGAMEGPMANELTGA